jgi:hypothetical protein
MTTRDVFDCVCFLALVAFVAYALLYLAGLL